MLNYETVGEGTPILLIAGLGTDSTCWALQVPDLQQQARVLAVDCPGVGRNRHLEAPRTAEAVADLLATILEEPAVVVGHSLGGAVAQHLALRHPDKVHGLVLAATAARLDDFCLDVLRSWLGWHREGLSRDAFALGFLPWVFSRRFFENAAVVAEARRLYVESPWPQAVESFANQVAACEAHDTRGRLGGLAVPTVVISASEDLIAPPVLGQDLAAEIPGARFVLLEGCGHACQAEAAEAFNREVRSLL